MIRSIIYLFLTTICISCTQLKYEEADNCYNYHITTASYFLHQSNIESAYHNLDLALAKNRLLPQDYPIALEIYIRKKKENKATPLLRLMVSYGYNYSSLYSNPTISSFLKENKYLDSSLVVQYADRNSVLKQNSMNIIIDSLYKEDQYIRKNGQILSQNEFNTFDAQIGKALVDKILSKGRLPYLTEVGYKTHGKLYTLLLHQINNHEYNDLVWTQIQDSYESRNYSVYEYSSFIDRKNLLEEGYALFGMIGSFSQNGEYVLGENVKNISSIDSLRFHELGLLPLKYQAEMSNSLLSKGYELQIFNCGNDMNATQKFEIDTIPLDGNR